MSIMEDWVQAYEPAKPAWFENWMALHGTEARWDKTRGCWVVYMDTQAVGVWEACYPAYSLEDWLEALRQHALDRETEVI